MSLTKVTYSLIDGAYVNVLDYGADRTGVVDSAAAIQAAIDACDGQQQRTVYMPGGVYLIASNINVKEGVALIGEGNTTAFSNGSQGYPTRIFKGG